MGFGNTNWPADYGYVGGLAGTVVTVPASTTTGSTEGTDQYTFTTASAGLYRVNVQMINHTVSDSATSCLESPRLSYVDSVSTKSTVTFSVTTIDLKSTSQGAIANWSLIIRANRLTDIVTQVQSTITGANSTGKVLWSVSIEKIGN